MNITIKQYTYTIGSFIVFLAVLYYFLKLSLFLSIGLTILVFIHELGHIIALKKLHKKIDGLYFLPFFGAVVVSKESFDNVNDYAFFKYLGPFVGTIGVSLVGLCYLILGDVRLLHLVFIGSIFNLVNMVPITFLDGYGVLKGISKKVEWLGIIALIGIGCFMFEEYMLTFFLLLIATLFGEDDATGFRWFEPVFATIFIAGMIFVAVIEGGEYLVYNIVFILASLYTFIQYLRSVLPIGKKYENNSMILCPLSLKQKYLWGIKWLLLTSVLVLVLIFI